MSRVINLEGAGKIRTQLCRGIVLALRELMRQSEPGETSHDLAAYIIFSLEEVYATIDASVTAWEKKGYWVKADRFRMEWDWTLRLMEKLRKALLEEDWASIAGISVNIGQKLMNVKLPERHRLGTPWIGAWDKFSNSNR